MNIFSRSEISQQYLMNETWWIFFCKKIPKCSSACFLESLTNCENRSSNSFNFLTLEVHSNLRNFNALIVIEIKIFNSIIIVYLHKFSKRIILNLEGCLSSVAPSANLAHFLSTLPSEDSKKSDTSCLLFSTK